MDESEGVPPEKVEHVSARDKHDPDGQYTSTISIRIPLDLLKAVDMVCRKTGVRRSRFITYSICMQLGRAYIPMKRMGNVDPTDVKGEMSFRETRRECLLPPTIDEVIEAMLSIDAPTAESLNPKPRPKPQPKPLGPVNEIDWEAEEKVREQREKAEM